MKTIQKVIWWLNQYGIPGKTTLAKRISKNQFETLYFFFASSLLQLKKYIDSNVDDYFYIIFFVL